MKSNLSISVTRVPGLNWCPNHLSDSEPHPQKRHDGRCQQPVAKFAIGPRTDQPKWVSFGSRPGDTWWHMVTTHGNMETAGIKGWKFEMIYVGVAVQLKIWNSLVFTAKTGKWMFIPNKIWHYMVWSIPMYQKESTNDKFISGIKELLWSPVSWSWFVWKWRAPKIRWIINLMFPTKQIVISWVNHPHFHSFSFIKQNQVQ